MTAAKRKPTGRRRAASAGTDLSTIEAQLGILIGQMEGVRDRLDGADDSRRSIYVKLEELVIRQTNTEAHVGVLEEAVGGMQSVTAEVQKLRERAMGAGTAGRWLLRIAVTSVTFAGWVFGFYTWLTGRPPP